MTYNDFASKYTNFFAPIVRNTPISLDAALKLSYELTKPVPKTLKYNNFFAIANQQTKKYKQYLTPFDGIKAGLNLLLSNKDFIALKLGTLKANPDLQVKRILAAFYTD